MNDKRSQFIIINDIVNDKYGHNIVNDSLLISQRAYLFDFSPTLTSESCRVWRSSILTA